MPIRIELTRTRCGASSTASDLIEVLHARTRRRSRHHMRLRLQREQRIHADHGRVARAAVGCIAQHRQKGAGGANHAEVFEVEFFAPCFVARIGEGRHAALARVVDQHVSAAEACLHRLCKRVDVVGVQHVAAASEQSRGGKLRGQCGLGLRETFGIAAADRNRCAALSKTVRRTRGRCRTSRPSPPLPARSRSI